MKYSFFSILLILGFAIYFSACKDGNDGCTVNTWYQDADSDGLGNPAVSQDACGQPSGYVSNSNDTDDTGTSGNNLHPAFGDFDDDNFTIYLDGNEVVIESNGLPNHTSPYWSDNHPLFVEPTVTSYAAMAPGNIDNFNGSFTLRAPVSPQLAASSSSTGLGAIGIAISGGMIYNDEEGPNVPLDDAVPSLDYTAAHTGPQSYHYHLEPKAWSDVEEETTMEHTLLISMHQVDTLVLPFIMLMANTIIIFKMSFT